MAVALNAVPRQSIATASSFLNVGSRVGGALGIAVLNTIVTNEAHVHAVRLGAKSARESVAFGHLAQHVAYAPSLVPAAAE